MLLVRSQTAIELASTDNPLGGARMLRRQGGAEAFIDVVFGIADADDLRIRHLGPNLASTLVTKDPAVAFLVLDGNFSMLLPTGAELVWIASPGVGGDGAQAQSFGSEGHLGMRVKADLAL